MSSAERTPEQIARDIAATRNRLAGTVDQLVYRAKPQTIARNRIAEIRASVSRPDGSPDVQKLGTLAGIAVGVVVALVVIRKVVG